MIKFVREAQSAGFSLGDISKVLNGDWKNRELAELARHQRKIVQTKIETLKKMEQTLSVLENCCCETFDQCDLNAVLLAHD